MAAKKDISQEEEGLLSIKEMIEVYEEIAANYMQKTRSSVLNSRNFLGGISEIFKQVKLSYKNDVERLMKKNKKKESSGLTFRKTNGKTVYVLLSANTGLYGDIVKRTFDLFLTEIKKEKCDIAVIGRLGKSLFDRNSGGLSYSFFELPDSKFNQNDLIPINKFLVQYEKIIVFYGQFQSIVTQNPTLSSVSGDYTTLEKNGEESIDRALVKYFFEPDLGKVMEFFEQEIFSSIFEQTVHESLLAKYASRIITLDSAIENIKKNVKRVEFLKQNIKHREANRKQLGTLSSMALWRKYG